MTKKLPHVLIYTKYLRLARRENKNRRRYFMAKISARRQCIKEQKEEKRIIRAWPFHELPPQSHLCQEWTSLLAVCLAELPRRH